MNISIKREQSEQVHSAECEKGGMKANFLELTKNRYSCRAYKTLDVEEPTEKVTLFEAGLHILTLRSGRDT